VSNAKAFEGDTLLDHLDVLKTLAAQGTVQFAGREIRVLDYIEGVGASLDSGAKCNRAMQTGFARLCQAL
jgi:hypothetical protein